MTTAYLLEVKVEGVFRPIFVFSYKSTATAQGESTGLEYRIDPIILDPGPNVDPQWGVIVQRYERRDLGLEGCS